MILPDDPRAIILAAILDGARPVDTCPTCQGRGWIEFADPFLGGHLDARCPDCEEK